MASELALEVEVGVAAVVPPALLLRSEQLLGLLESAVTPQVFIVYSTMSADLNTG